jgi:6-phosphogluconolactonase
MKAFRPAISRKTQFACLFLLLGLLSTTAQSSFAQSDPPLTFGNNFFVTGDYVVAGAQGMTTNFDSNNGLAIGKITVPDPNPGIKPSLITGTNSVPTGAQIVAAILYWQTVEKIGVIAGQPGSGQNGFFRPLITGGVTAPGYPISGSQLNPVGSNAVSWSSGGCTNGSTGKVVRTYRTSVLGYLPVDSSGNVTPNVQYEVRLPGTSSTTPIAVGASLVLIYRVISSNFPLNSIVIYDGDFATNATSIAAMTMTQAMQGFYDAETDLTQHPGAKLESRLTHIVGNGKAKKTETVSLNGQVLPSFYPNGRPSFPPYTGAQPPFPGFYGTWDNPTWTFDPGQTYVSLSNPIGEHSGSATTQVAASGANPGCASWGATIVSTTVNNSDGDGILDVWKVPPAPNAATPGYCDASVNEGQCNGPGDPAWVDLPGAVKGEKDVFIQLDYMCSSPNGVDSCTTGDGTNYSFDPRLTNAARPIGADVMMKNAFSLQGIHLHINPVNPLGTTQPVHAIQELTCMDNSNNPLCASVNANGLTPFPNQPGVVGWKAGFEFIQSQPLNYPDEISCEQALSGPCIRRFQPGRKDSYHYALFAHAIGTPTWGLLGGSLASVTAFTNGDIKFTTSAPHGLVVDPNLGNGRVTIADAITNPNLNGTYKVTSVSPPAGVLNIMGTSMSALGIATYTFTQVSGPAPAPGDLVTVQNTTNGNTVFNVGNATIATVVGSTFTVNFNVNGFIPSLIVAQPETGGCAPAFPTGACAHTNRAPFYFTINISPSTVSTQTSYTESTDPNLTVTSGQATTGSGFSDIGGADTLVTLGLWGNPAFDGSSPATSPASDGQKATVQAGTFMHELGHTLGLTHGGLFFDNVAHNPPDYTPTFDVNCKSNYQSVMNYMFQTDLLGPSNALDFSSQQLDPLNETLLFPIALGGSTGAVKFQTTTWYDLTPSLVGSKAKHHCDGSPTFFNANVAPFSADVTPIMYPHLNKALPSPWSAPSLDINFNGTIDNAGFRGYNDWLNVDLRQIGASGPDLGGSGRAGGGPGRAGGGPGRAGGGPGRAGGGPGRAGGGPGKEIDFATANDVTRPPRNLMASEEASPRFIDLSWTAPIFGQIGAYRIYRSAGGGAPFALIATVPGSQTTFRDGVTTPPPCNTTGYQYFVTAVLAGTFAAFPPGPTEGQESEPSNTVSVGQNVETLTACYGPTGFNFSAPANAVQGSIPSITWTVQDASNKSGFGVPVSAVNTLVVNGPLPSSCTTVGDTTILANGMLTAQSGALSAFSQPSQGQYTFNWDTDGFCAGKYTVKLILDNQLALSSHQMATAPLQLSIDVTNTDNPQIITVALPSAVVGIPYMNTVIEDGGVSNNTTAFSWTIAMNSVMPGGGSTLPGISFLTNAVGTTNGTLSGTPTTPGDYTFTAQVKDSVGNIGMQTLKLHVAIPGGLIYVANCTATCASVVDFGNVSAYIIDATNGALIPVTGAPFAAGQAPFWVTVDPAARFAYVANLGNNVSAYSIDATTGALSPVPGSPFNSGGNPSSVAVDPTGRFAYVANRNAGTVSAYTIDAGTGALAPVGSPVATGSSDFTVAVDPSGQFAYVANEGSNNISAYSIDQTTGALTAVPGSPFSAGTSPFVIAVDPAAPFAYVANNLDNTISAYSIDGTTGALSSISGSPFATGTSPRSVTVDPLGQFLYTANQGGTVSAFTISATTGALSAVAGSPFAAGSQPVSVAVDTTSKFAYTANASSNDVSAYSINATTGALTAVPAVLGSPFKAGTYPVSVAATTYACAAFPAGPPPFATIYSIATDTAGDTFVVGTLAGGTLPALPLPSVSNERFCNPVTLETNYTVPAFVPTTAERNGDFSAYAGLTLRDQSGNPYAGNIVPAGVFAWRIAPHSSNLTRLPCSLEPSLKSIEAHMSPTSTATFIQFANDTAGPVNVYWINYQGQRVFYRGGPYSALAAGTAYTQGTFITHPWIITDVATNSCLGIWLPTESLGTAVITGSAPTPLPPPAPTNLSAAVQPSGPGAESVVLTWNASNGAAGYNVYRATVSQGPFTKLTPMPTTNLTFTDGTVQNGTTYYYATTAVDASGHEGAYSTLVPAMVPVPPQAPTNLMATPGSPGSGAVTLAWTASATNSVSYNVYRSTTSGAYTSANKIASGVSATSYPDSGLTSGTTYYYVVTAVDAGGNESPFSNEAFVTAP